MYSLSYERVKTSGEMVLPEDKNTPRFVESSRQHNAC